MLRVLTCRPCSERRPADAGRVVERQTLGLAARVDVALEMCLR
jgi:hypothetical protein